jgi:hypothetical protein
MKTLHFPITVVDDFFECPDEVREFALQQEYLPDPDNKWPGKRTKPLHELNPALFSNTINRVFSLFYNLEKTPTSWITNAYFQKVSEKYEEGWVHMDDNICTGIVYLSKSKNKCGTTIYRPIDPINARLKNENKKIESFKNTDLITSTKDFRLENNKQFRPTTIIQEEYNRLVFFDAHLLHSANEFYGNKDDDDDARLTLVFFVKQIHIHEDDAFFPVPRMKKYIG